MIAARSSNESINASLLKNEQKSVDLESQSHPAVATEQRADEQRRSLNKFYLTLLTFIIVGGIADIYGGIALGVPDYKRDADEQHNRGRIMLYSGTTVAVASLVTLILTCIFPKPVVTAMRFLNNCCRDVREQRADEAQAAAASAQQSLMRPD